MDNRLCRLGEEHVRPLMALIEELRSTGLLVPNVDPNDGGVFARALFLLTTPGPKAVASGFVSRDNPDDSAKNMGTSLDLAGLRRRDVVLWNVVPHCLSTIDESRNPTTAEIRESIPATQRFMDRIVNLRVVIFCGKTHTQKALRWLHKPTGIKFLPTAHTGAKAFNRPVHRSDIHRTFIEAARLING